MIIPEKGQAALHKPTQTEFVVTRRTRREDGSIFLWHHQTPTPPLIASWLPLARYLLGSLVVDVRNGHQATVVKIDGDYCFVDGQSLSGWVPVKYLRLSVEAGLKVIVAGSRTITDYALVERAMVESGLQVAEVVSGKEPNGVDRLGELWAEKHGVAVKAFPAAWKQHGKERAPLRNGEMVAYADALVAVWDGASRGTSNVIQQAKDAGLQVFVLRTDQGSKLQEVTALTRQGLEALIAMCGVMTGDDLALLETLTQEQKRQLWGELSVEGRDRLKYLPTEAKRRQAT